LSRIFGEDQRGLAEEQFGIDPFRPVDRGAAAELLSLDLGVVNPHVDARELNSLFAHVNPDDPHRI